MINIIRNNTIGLTVQYVVQNVAHRTFCMICDIPPYAGKNGSFGDGTIVATIMLVVPVFLVSHIIGAACNVVFTPQIVKKIDENDQSSYASFLPLAILAPIIKGIFWDLKK